MMRSVLVCLTLALASAGCDDPQAGVAPPGNTPGAAAGTGSGTAPGTSATPSSSIGASASASATGTSGAAASATSTSGSNGARAVAEETDDFVFNYAYPAQAGAIPKLGAILDGWLERERTSLARESAAARADARSNGFPYNKYSGGMKWQVVADLPDWLSLSGELDAYTGGAHGNYGVESLVWDKQQGTSMKAIDLFTSPKALSDALGKRLCAGLDKLRAARRPEPIEGDDYGFNACPKIDEYTVLAGSSNKRTFNRLTLYAGPYVAGPYVEGAYEVNLDVDQAVIAAVKPQYRASFSVRR